MSKEKMIPELRFPEFNNEGEWEEKPLGYFCDYWNGTSNEAVIIEDGRYYLISLNSIDIEGNLKSEMKRVPNTDNSLKKGNLVMVLSDVAHGNFLGLTAIIPNDNYVLNQRMAGLGIKDFKKIDATYLRLFINGNQSYFKKQGQGSSQQNLSKASVVDFPVLVPSRLMEQKKIASFLSSLDEVIISGSLRLDLLKEHKKGLMQNLFPQEGETVPKYRFKEFENDGDWVDKTIDDVCKLVRGPFGGALKKEIFVKEGYAVYEQSHAIYSDFSSFRYFIDEDKFNELNRFSVKAGDLIMSCSGTMGKFAIVPEDYKSGVINQALLKLSVKKGYDKTFVKMTLEADNNQEKLLSQSAGGAIKNVVSVSQIKELCFLLPSIKEQQKIVSCLSSLDALITAQVEKIEQLKLHKKGLMQGLFPKIQD